MPAAKWVSIVFGAGAFLYAALTAYELGFVRLLPMPLHLMLDGLGGAVLAASPLMFRFADQVYLPVLSSGSCPLRRA